MKSKNVSARPTVSGILEISSIASHEYGKEEVGDFPLHIEGQYLDIWSCTLHVNQCLERTILEYDNACVGAVPHPVKLCQPNAPLYRDIPQF